MYAAIVLSIVLAIAALAALLLAVLRLPINTIAQLLKLFDAEKARLYHAIMSSQRLRVEEHAIKPSATITPLNSKGDLLAAFQREAVHSRLATTRTQTRILDLLWNLAHNLSMGRYTSINGAATVLLLGAQGIGKTSTCKAFVDLCPAILSISCIWVDCDGFGEDDHPLRLANLKMCIALRLFGHTFQRAWSLLQGPLGDLDTLLASHQRRAMIIVDELDEVYRLSPTKGANTALNMLGMLQLQGNSREGRTAVVLCGSSAQLPSLISGSASKVLRNEFPLLLGGTPDLNSTKYASQRAWAPTCTDVATAKAVLKALGARVGAKDLRHLVFTMGANPRELSELALNGSLAASETRRSALASNDRHRPYARGLLNAILDALFKRNRKLLAPMADSLARASSNASWPTAFEPLSYEQVEEQWAALLAAEQAGRREEEPLQATLFYLCDRGYLVYEAGGRSVYPDAVLTVITRHLEQRDPILSERYRKEAFAKLAALNASRRSGTAGAKSAVRVAQPLALVARL